MVTKNDAPGDRWVTRQNCFKMAAPDAASFDASKKGLEGVR